MFLNVISSTVVRNEVSLVSSIEDEEGAFLQIMKIPALKPERESPYKVVLWDRWSTNHYVHNSQARRMGFPSRRETMRVLTFGGDMKTIDRIIYRCQISDQEGNIEEFVAHGLDKVTRVLSNPLMLKQLKQMFSNNPMINRPAGTQRVDYFPGLCNPSCQLEHVTNSNGWGDFWLYRSRFGDCLGGSHP